MDDFVLVGKETDFVDGKPIVTSVNGIDVMVVRVNGEIFACQNRCPHEDGPLGEGEMDGDVIECPLHGWKFCVRDGSSPMFPTISIETFEVKIENGEVFVRKRSG